MWSTDKQFNKSTFFVDFMKEMILCNHVIKDCMIFTLACVCLIVYLPVCDGDLMRDTILLIQ